MVLGKQDEFPYLWNLPGVSGNEFVFMALDSKVEILKQHNGQTYH